MNVRHSTPFVLGLAAFVLSPGLARADALDCSLPRVEISSPTDGSSFEGDPAEVAVTVAVTSGDMPRSVAVNVDGTEAESMSISDLGNYDFSLELGAGSYQLEAVFHDDCEGSATSDPVSITVMAPSSGDQGEDDGHDDHGDDGHDDGHDDHGDDGDGGGSDDGGCAVSRTPNRTIVGLSAFMLAVLGAWRLRRAGT
jgi:hypothetical protein